MTDSPNTQSDEQQIRGLFERWASTTRRGQLDQVLANHSPDVLIFDVLPPMEYEGAEAYRRSWGDWQPETQGEGQFELQDLVVCAGAAVAFAHALIKCGGTLPNGKKFEDLVRATFCLIKTGNRWSVAHQHISKPFVPSTSAA